MNIQLSRQEYEAILEDLDKVKNYSIETFDSMDLKIEELEGQIKTNEATIKQLNENLNKKDEEILRLKSTIKDLRSGVSKKCTGPIKATGVTNHKKEKS